MIHSGVSTGPRPHRGFTPSPASRARCCNPLSPRVRRLTRGFTLSPASRVGRDGRLLVRLHGFADSPVALLCHPLRGFDAAIRCLHGFDAAIHGFADSPVALLCHPLRGLGGTVVCWFDSTGSRTHPWL